MDGWMGHRIHVCFARCLDVASAGRDVIDAFIDPVGSCLILPVRLDDDVHHHISYILLTDGWRCEMHSAKGWLSAFLPRVLTGDID